MKTHRFDPFLICFILIISLGFIFAYVLPKSHAELKESHRPTTYSHSRYGTEGLFLVMEKLGKDTCRWSSPYPLLETKEVGTLIVNSPNKPITPKEVDTLKLWFSKGGKMVFLAVDDWKIKSSGYDEEDISFLKTFEGYSQLTVIREPSQVWNQTLKKEPSECVGLIEDLLTHNGPIYFDEYHLNNGADSNVSELMRQFFQQPFGWMILHIIALFLIYLLCTPNERNRYHQNIKKQTNLVKERAAFLNVAKAHSFAKQVIHKYRSNTSV